MNLRKKQAIHADALLKLKADKPRKNRTEVVIDLVSPEKTASKVKIETHYSRTAEEEEEKIECDECYKRHRKETGKKEELKANKGQKYRQILVKNPDYTDMRKLGRGQTTLDPFIVDFKQSKYLKSTIVVSQHYKQLTFDDFPSQSRPSSRRRHP